MDQEDDFGGLEARRRTHARQRSGTATFGRSHGLGQIDPLKPVHVWMGQILAI